MSARAALALALAGAALALGAAPAGAATVSLSTYDCVSPKGGCPFVSHALEVRDTAGEPNEVRLVREPGALVVIDARTPPTAGHGCASVAPDRVRCATPLGPASSTVDAGAGDDVVDASGHTDAFIPSTLGGGPGADVLVGSPSGDTLSGGGGVDRIDGGGGDDALRDDDRTGVDAGPDALDGGAGVDVVIYEGRTAGVTVDLAAGGPAGEAGENDALTGLERVIGGAGDDVLRAAGGAGSELGSAAGGAGNDRVAGPGRVFGGPGDDLVEGGEGNDRLEGGGGRDRLLGAGGDDVLADSDQVRAGVLRPAPADADVLDGGDGRDTLSYAGRTGRVVVDLAAGTGGAAGEGDTLAGLEDVLGGESGDLLMGDGGANRLLADGALGLVTGADLSALDRLVGGDGDDTLEGGPGPDDYDAGAGDDTVIPGNGGDRLIEPLACGRGADLVRLPDPRDLVRDCERAELDQPGVGGRAVSALVRFPLRPLRGGRVWLGLRCRRCRPTLEATLLTADRRLVRRSVVRLRGRRAIVLRAPPRARLLRLRYSSQLVGIPTGLIARLPR
jgi:Ca2+-binding RTX toxin-like protein